MNITQDMKQDFANSYQEWSDAMVQIEAARTLQKEILDELAEKYPDVKRSDINWLFTTKYKNNADEQETAFDDRKGLYESLF